MGRFELPQLKRRAVAFLAQGVNTDNAVECVLTCDAFDLRDLRQRMLKALAANKKALAEITSSPVIAAHPQLLREILVHVAGPQSGSPAGPSSREGAPFHTPQRGRPHQTPPEKRARR